MIWTAILAGVQLATSLLEHLPESDPELRRLRAQHRMEMAALQACHRHERRMARLTRRP